MIGISILPAGPTGRGAFDMWVRVLIEKDQYSITVGKDYKSVTSCANFWSDEKPVVVIREVLALFIAYTGFVF